MFISKLKSEYLRYWLAVLGVFSPSVVKNLLSKSDVIQRLLVKLLIVSVLAFVVFCLNFCFAPLIKAIGERLRKLWMGG